MLQQTLHTLHLETSTDQTHKSTHPRVTAIIRSANSSNILVTSVTDKGQGPCFPAEVTVVYFFLFFLSYGTRPTYPLVLLQVKTSSCSASLPQIFSCRVPVRVGNLASQILFSILLSVAPLSMLFWWESDLIALCGHNVGCT